MTSRNLDDDAMALLGLVLISMRKSKRKKKRELSPNVPNIQPLNWRIFVQDNFPYDLKFKPEDHKHYLRMNEGTYLVLLSMVTPLIEKKDTIMRKSISAHERLKITLKYLATGRTYENLKHSSNISAQALGHIIPETCDALYKVLSKEYLKFPTSQEEWKEIAELFESQCNFPHCMGVLDAKHVEITTPAGNWPEHCNYKSRHSMVLFGLVNAKHQFVMADFGINGKISDGSVLYNTAFYKKLLDQTLRTPNVENSNDLPYVFVGNDALPLQPDILKSFQSADSQEKKIFNYRLKRTRWIAENAFGILSSRFRIYHTPICLKPDNIKKIVMASCALHNFLIHNSLDTYAPSECFYREDLESGIVESFGYHTKNSKMEDLLQRSDGDAIQEDIREKFANYFSNEGSVSWQNHFVT